MNLLFLLLSAQQKQSNETNINTENNQTMSNIKHHSNPINSINRASTIQNRSCVKRLPYPISRHFKLSSFCPYHKAIYKRQYFITTAAIHTNFRKVTRVQARNTITTFGWSIVNKIRGWRPNKHWQPEQRTNLQKTGRHWHIIAKEMLLIQAANTF